jgi:hypothetical protein
MKAGVKPNTGPKHVVKTPPKLPTKVKIAHNDLIGARKGDLNPPSQRKKPGVSKAPPTINNKAIAAKIGMLSLRGKKKLVGVKKKSPATSST